MRQYLFTLIALTILLVACKPSPTYETSSENRVNTFTFYTDTLNPGLTEAIYKIEHREYPDTGLIYNKDSLRFGTRLDSVVPYITYKATPGSATFYLPNDTIVCTGYDTVNLEEKPVYLHVLASDMQKERWYRIDINAHKINPDLYIWTQLAENICSTQNYETKAFYINSQFVLFVNNGLSTQVYTSSDATSWSLSNQAPNGLPVPCYVRDIIQHNDQLYYIANKTVYRSEDDLYTWTATDYSTASFEPINMLMSYDNKAWCIIQDTITAQLTLATIQADSITPCTCIEGLKDGVLPAHFPISDFATATFQSSSERPRAMVVGGRNIQGEPVNSRWNLEFVSADSIYRLKDFTISQPTFHTLTGASIIQYNKHLIMFGGIDNDQEWNSNILYSNDEGMNWYAPNPEYNQLPSQYQSRHKQSVIVEQNAIYLIGGQSDTTSFSDVYCGRLNSLL